MRLIRVLAAVLCLWAACGAAALGAEARQGTSAKATKLASTDTATDRSGAGPALRAEAPIGNLKWRLELEQNPACPWEDAMRSISVANGVLYLGTADMLVALDPATGQEKWRFPTVAPVVSKPVVLEGGVFFAANNYECASAFYALDEATGKQVWSRPDENGVLARAGGGGGLVYFGFGGDCNALDALTGKQLWSHSGDRLTEAAPSVVVDQAIYAGYGVDLFSTDAGLCVLDAHTGRRKWMYSTQGCVTRAPAVCDGVVYLSDENHNLYALDAASGLKKWAVRTNSSVSQAPVICGKRLLLGCNDGLYAFDTDDGRAKWSVRTKGSICDLPVVSEAVVYFDCNGGTTYAVTIEDGREKWHFDGAGDMVVTGDSVYVTGAATGLHVLDLKTGAEKWRFHMKGLFATQLAVAADATVFFQSRNYIYAVSEK